MQAVAISHSPSSSSSCSSGASLAGCDGILSPGHALMYETLDNSSQEQTSASYKATLTRATEVPVSFRHAMHDAPLT